MTSAHATIRQLRKRIRRDPEFAAGLHALKTTEEASRFCKANHLNLSSEQIWSQRGQLFADGQPTWRG
jgi:predicted alpha/beta-hydrolase family hydrolase